MLQKGIELLEVELFLLILESQDDHKLADVDVVRSNPETESTHDSLQFILDDFIIFEIGVEKALEDSVSENILPRGSSLLLGPQAFLHEIFGQRGQILVHGKGYGLQFVDKLVD